MGLVWGSFCNTSPNYPAQQSFRSDSPKNLRRRQNERYSNLSCETVDSANNLHLSGWRHQVSNLTISNTIFLHPCVKIMLSFMNAIYLLPSLCPVCKFQSKPFFRLCCVIACRASVGFSYKTRFNSIVNGSHALKASWWTSLQKLSALRNSNCLYCPVRFVHNVTLPGGVSPERASKRRLTIQEGLLSKTSGLESPFQLPIFLCDGYPPNKIQDVLSQQLLFRMLPLQQILDPLRSSLETQDGFAGYKIRSKVHISNS